MKNEANVFGAALSRRSFVRAGGALFVGFGMVGADGLKNLAKAAAPFKNTPDGSGAFDFLGGGTPNIRKAAAYTYQALLDLGAQRLGVPKDAISVRDGV